MSSANVSNGTNILTGIWTYDDPNSYDPAGVIIPTAIQTKDCRTHDPNKAFYLYKNCRPFSKSQNVAW